MGFDELITFRNHEVLDQHCFEKLRCKCVLPENLVEFDKLPFSLLHLNTRSLIKHHNDLLSLLASIDHKFNIIGCSETWINERTYLNTLNMDGYVLYNKNRTSRPGGGVCLYVNIQQSVTVLDDLLLEDGLSDSLFIEIHNENMKSIIVGIVYQPPDSDLNCFLTKLDEILSSINYMNKHCFILGDFNINLAKDDSAKNDFLNCLYSSNFFPTISSYTRVTETTKSTIDNIITNINVHFDSGVIISDITDHFPIVLFIDLDTKIRQQQKKTLPLKKSIKVLTGKYLDKLLGNLRHKTWDSVFSWNTPEEAYSAFINELTNSINITILEKIVKGDTSNQNTWLTRES